MRIFISWSGDRAKKVALGLREWLPDVIQALDPWHSEEDIGKGRRSITEIDAALEGAAHGIIVVTRANQSSRWLNYEAGALAKQVDRARVTPLLLDLPPEELLSPLSGFQATDAHDQQDVMRMMSDFNDDLGDGAIADDRLEKQVNLHWDALVERLAFEDGESEETVRSVPDKVDELLLLTRAVERHIADLRNFNAHPRSGVGYSNTDAARRIDAARKAAENYDAMEPPFTLDGAPGTRLYHPQHGLGIVTAQVPNVNGYLAVFRDNVERFLLHGDPTVAAILPDAAPDADEQGNTEALRWTDEAPGRETTDHDLGDEQ